MILLDYLLGTQPIHLIHLHDFGFLFVIGGMLAIIALRTIRSIKKTGKSKKILPWEN
jgi:hypothetical protein